MKTRREFLAGCSILAAAASVAPTAILTARPAALSSSIDQVSFGAFRHQVATRFGVLGKGASRIEIELVEAISKPPGGPSAANSEDAGNEKFTLLFRSRQGPKLEQNTYAFDHPDIGRFDLFIVPVQRPESPDTYYYEAIFNRQPVVDNERSSYV